MSSLGRKYLAILMLLLMVACDDEVEDMARCDESSQCLPSYICQDGFCVLGSRNTQLGVCEEGDTIALATGRLEIPEDALDRCVQITFEEASGTVQPEGLVPLSPVFVASPSDTDFLTDIFVELEFQKSELMPGEVAYVYRAEDLSGQWIRLPNTTITGTIARGSSRRLGNFVVAVEPREPVDAGVAIDSGLHPDAMTDTGFYDGGVPVDAGMASLDTGLAPDAGIGDMDAMMMGVPDSGIMPPPDSGMMEIPDTGIEMPADTGMLEMSDGGAGGPGQTDTGMGGPGMEDTGMGSMPDLGTGGMPDSGLMGTADTGLGNIPDSGGGNIPDSGFGGAPDSGGSNIPDSGFGGAPDTGGGMMFPDTGAGFPDSGGLLQDTGSGGGGGMMDLGIGAGSDTGSGGTLEDSGGGFGGPPDGGIGMSDSGNGGPPDPGGGGGMPGMGGTGT